MEVQRPLAVGTEEQLASDPRNRSVPEETVDEGALE